MTTTIVKDAAGLTAALKAAHAGDVIKLAAGTYSPVLVNGLNYGSGVTVTSLDIDNPAKLTGLTVKATDGLNFQNLEFVVNGGGAPNPFQVLASKNISFDHLSVHGSLDGNAQNDTAAMLIRSSTNVKVTNSEFQQLQHGVAHLDSNGLTISGNYFHDIRTDGIRGGGSSKVTISDNYFTNFHPADGDHPDAVQFWTTGTKAAASDIVVSGNIVTRGSGDPIQGVFFRDQVGGMTYQNVVVSDNLIVGGLYNGIVVSGSNNVTVEDNTVLGLQDQRSWISTDGASNVTLTNNVGTDYNKSETVGLTESGNKTVPTPTDGGQAAQQAWLADHAVLMINTLQIKPPTGDVVNATNITAATLDEAAAAALREIELTRMTMVHLSGTTGADRMGADGVHDMLMESGDGNDLLTGGGVGHNTMVGGRGDDTYNVKSDYDTVVEGVDGGSDTVVAYIDYALTDNVETLRMMSGATYGAGNALNNKITGTADADEIRGMGGDDALQGLDGNDRMFGGEGNDNIAGGVGDDTLQGDGGNDKVGGGEGNDSMAGGAGADTLEGSTGADSMSGGAGADQFFFREGDISATPDRIFDFNRVDGDKISVAMIDANVNVTGDQKFAFLGTAAFTKVAGQARYDVVGGESHVSFDVNGDGLADMKLIVGTSSLTGADFVL